MNFEESLVIEINRTSREFAFYGAVIGFVAGVCGSLLLQAVFQ